MVHGERRHLAYVHPLGVSARRSAATWPAAPCSAPPGAEGGLGELVNEYAAHSPQFAASRREHDVRPVATLRKRLYHPELGQLDLDCQILLVPGTGLLLVLYTAQPGGPSAAALARLAT
ncbi:hypothetical protein [Spongiactinospora sp. 9N601]|uniref:MmyB family transcriptional regulator n=1 Tax=Spongiactinospora sp. 9N601 TaxID=3375149 RepID=UPI0037A07010